MTILAFGIIFAGKNRFLPAKTIFASLVFFRGKTGFSTVWQKPDNPSPNSPIQPVSLTHY